jgi:Fe-S-cluster containining protein
MSDIFQNTALAEYQRAAKQLQRDRDAVNALKASYQQHDQLITTVIDSTPIKPACKAGCAFCCYYKVEVRAHEVFVVKAYMEKNMSHAEVAALLTDAKTNADRIRQLTPEQHLSANIQCAFLKDNQCQIYSARPYRCRNFHATNAGACEQSFHDPDNMSITTGLIHELAMHADAHTQGFEAAAAHAGLDQRIYEFTTAIIEAFDDAKSLKRYQHGKKAFQRAIEVI